MGDEKGKNQRCCCYFSRQRNHHWIRFAIADAVPRRRVSRINCRAKSGKVEKPLDAISMFARIYFIHLPYVIRTYLSFVSAWIVAGGLSLTLFHFYAVWFRPYYRFLDFFAIIIVNIQPQSAELLSCSMFIVQSFGFWHLCLFACSHRFYESARHVHHQ